MTSPGSGFVRACALVLLVLLAPFGTPGGAARAQDGSVRVQLGATSISIDESVRLAIVATGIDGELDTAALEREFDVVGRSSSRDVQVLNGTRRSTVTWVLELAPRAVGVFTVPPVSVGGVESELLTLTVTDAPTGAERDVFVEASVDTDTPYVQSQVVLTLRVFRGVDIVDGSLGEPAGAGLDVRALGDDRRYDEERDGRTYVVDERRFALFPQASGPLVVVPIALSVTVAADPSRVRGFFSPTRKLTRRTRPITLDVRPRPAGPTGGSGWWLPAKDVALEESWSGNGGGETRVGEPLTRTLRLRADGVLDTQLPELALPSVPGLAIYADDPVRASAVGPAGLESTQTLAFAVIPERPGTFELPSVSIDWFDAAAGETRTASLPARTITVVPGASAARSPAAPATPRPIPAPDGAAAAIEPATAGPVGAVPAPVADAAMRAASGRWRTLALVALVGWAITAAALLHAWRQRRSARAEASVARTPGEWRADAASVREARRRVEKAAAAEDAADLARAALARAALHWPDAPRSLAALARRLGAASGAESELGRMLHALDAELYRPATGEPSERGAAGRFATLPASLERALERRAEETDATSSEATRVGALPPL